MPEDNKTEQATPRRRQKAREKGQVARSRELVAGVAGLTMILVLALGVTAFPTQWRAMLQRQLHAAASGGSRNDLFLGLSGSLDVFRGTAIALGLSWLVAVVSAVAQGGLVLAPSALSPNLSRMSPAGRLRTLFSLPALGRLLKSLLPVVVMVYLATGILARDWGTVLHLPGAGIAALTRFSLACLFEMAWKSAFVLLLWSAVDYLLERRKFESELRMSRQELMDEFKEMEGHPLVKSRIRRLQRMVRRRRMLKDVERAAVVVTNPTEFAVALEYGPQMPAPVVVAKGRNLLAQQIKEIARWHQIPMIENPPLAHALYRAVEIGQSIPPKLYAVVAEVMAAIYRAHMRMAQGVRAGI